MPRPRAAYSGGDAFVPTAPLRAAVQSRLCEPQRDRELYVLRAAARTGCYSDVLHTPLTLTDVAQRLWGWRVDRGVIDDRHSDTRRLKRDLGWHQPDKVIRYDKALAIAEAIGVDPMDVGL